MVLCCARAGEEKEDLGRPGRNWVRLDWCGFQSSGLMSGQRCRSSIPSYLNSSLCRKQQNLLEMGCCVKISQSAILLQVLGTWQQGSRV